MPKHIILTDTAINPADVILVQRTSLPQAITGLTPNTYTVRDTSAPVSGTVTAPVTGPVAHDDVSAITVTTPLLGRVADTGQTWSMGNASVFDITANGRYVIRVQSSSDHRNALLSEPMASSAVYAEGVAHCQNNNTAFATQLILWSTPDGYGASDSGYALDYNGSLVRIMRYSGGVQTILSGSASYVAPIGGEFTLRFECEPGVQRAYLNGALVLTTNDTAITDGGYFGIGGRAYGAVPGNTAGSHFKSVAFGVL